MIITPIVVDFTFFTNKPLHILSL